jgi:subtilisin family serine protease
MNNGLGTVGINPYAKIMALRVGDKNSLTSSFIIKAIDFARENGAKIINASFGGAGQSA